METNKFGKRLLSLALALAVVVSMLSVVSITSFAASFNFYTKIYLADASYIDGNSDAGSILYKEVDDWSHIANWVIADSEYSISGYVNPEAYYYNDSGSEKYVFSCWKSSIDFSDYGTQSVSATTSKKQSYSIKNQLDFTGSVMVDGAVYQTYYRITVTGNGTDINEYVPYYDNFTLPAFDGELPEGKFFVGWKETDTNVVYVAGSEITPTTAMDFEPYFADVVYEHCYFKDADTGLLYAVCEVNPTTGKVEAPTAPTKQGYTFAGWSDGIDTVNAGDEIADAVNKTFYATWEANKYEIAVDVPESVDLDFHFPELDNTLAPCGAEVKFSLEIEEGKSLTGLTVEMDGTERFIAYKYDEATEYYSFVMPTEDVTIKATVTSDKILAYFKDPDTNQVYDIKYVDPDTDDLVTASMPTKEGYTFEYWYQIPGNEYGAEEVVTMTPASEYVFYAKWSVNSYMVDTNLQGGAVVNVSETNPDFGEVVTFDVNDIVAEEKITAITVEGKETNGFYAYQYDEITGKYSFVMPAENVEISVKTDIPAYLVYFKDYDGQIYDVVNYDPDEDVLHTPSAPTKKGYTFESWNNTAENEAEDSDVLAPNRAFNIYYAEWTPIVYNIDAVANVSGSAYVNVSATTSTYGTTVTFTVGDTNPNENIVGVEVLGTVDSRYVVYTFDELANEYSFVMPAEDVAIRVDTAIDEYAVTFLDYNNNYIATRVVMKGETVDADMPIEPVRAGYEFEKWQVCDEFGGGEFTSDTQVYCNVFVKAVYKGLDYNITKAEDCDDELEYLYVRSQDEYDYIYSDKDLTDSVAANGVAKAGDKVYVEVAPSPTYNITGVAIREPGTDNYVAAPTLIKKYKDANDNMCYKFAFTMPINDVEIAVYVAPNVYDVSVTEIEAANGEFRINGVDAYSLGVAQGELADIEIIPEDGYYVESVTATYIDEHGNTATPDGSLIDSTRGIWYYDFTMVSNDVNIEIVYAPVEYAVNVDDTNNENYKPVWNGDKYEVVESLEADKVSKGLVTLLDGADNDIEGWVMRETAKSCLQPINLTDANVGDQIKFKITEYIGYDLDYVLVTYAGGTKTCPVTKNGDIYYFTMPAAGVDINAYFVEETYKVTKSYEDEVDNDGVVATEKGVVTINGLRETEVAADYKDDVTVKVQPNPGFYVESIKFTLTADTNKDGEATVKNFSKSVKYSGTQLTDVADTEQSITFTMPAADVDIEVTYANIKYSVETEVTSGAETGKITVATPNSYDDEVEFTITPEYGYVLDNFTVVNVSTGKKIPYIAEKVNLTYGAKFTTTMPASKIKITAEFVKDAYQVTYLDSTGAYIGQEAIKYEETASLDFDVVNLPVGEHFTGWTSADTKVPVTAASLTQDDFVIVKNTIIVAAHETDKTDVVYKKTTNGYVTSNEIAANKTNVADQTHTYKYGDTVSFKAVPDEGYIVSEIKVTCKAADGVSTNYVPVTKTDSGYSFVIPQVHKDDVDSVKTDDVTLEVTFCKDNYVLTQVGTVTNGTVAVNGAVTTDTSYNYDYLDTVKITATPDKGYYVKSIVATMVDSATSTEDATHKYTYTGTKPATDVYGTEQSVSFNMPATDMTYSVEFAKCDFSITYTVKSGATTGTLTGTTLNQIGDKITFTATPKYGYILDTLTVKDNDGNIVFDTSDIDRTYGGTYDFVMPASPVKVDVNYIKDAYEVVYMDSNDTVLLTEAIEFEDTATLDTTPVSTPSGQHFVGWTSADTKTPVTNPSLSKADFVINKKTVIVANYATDATNVVYKKTANGYVTNTDIAAQLTKSADQKKAYKYGDTITFKAIPDEGYTIYEIKVTCKAPDGVATNYVPVIEGTDDYSFVIPAVHKTDVKTVTTDDVTLEVIFCKDEYTLEKKTAYKNGTVAVNGKVDTDTSYTYDYNGIVTITATPDKGYYVKSIVATMNSPVNSTENALNGYSYTYYGTVPANGSDGTEQSITFPMPATNMQYQVVFEKCNYIVTSNQGATLLGEHGTISISNDGVAQVDDYVRVVINPDSGYKVYSIDVTDENGSPIITLFEATGLTHYEQYSFTMPASNVNVHVKFVLEASREYLDVRDDAWYYNAIDFVTAAGLFRGYGAAGELFGPNDNIQRQDFVLVIAKMANADLAPYIGVESRFADVDKDAYYAAAIAWAADNGIISGYQNGNFGVGDYIIRQDIVTILYNFCEFEGYTTALSYEASTQSQYRFAHFKDLYLLSDYASSAMTWGVGYGVLNGKSTEKLAPCDHATRAEVAQMIKNLYDHNIAR